MLYIGPGWPEHDGLRPGVDKTLDPGGACLRWAKGAVGVHVKLRAIVSVRKRPELLATAFVVRANADIHELAGIQSIHGSVLGVSDSSTGLAVLPGGGVDVPITKALSVRVGADLPVVRNAGMWFSEFRFKTGVVYGLPIAR